MDVGGDLTVASLQDSAHSANRARGGSVSVGPGKGGGSAGVSAGQGSSDLAWVGDQTSVVGRSEVDIRVEGNTHLEGAVIAADNANLTLDTGSLTYADLHDSDEAEQFGLSVGAAWSGGGKGGAPKYRPDFPERFGCIEDAKGFCRRFFDWYNTQHHHSGLGLLTPWQVHSGQGEAIRAIRQKTLDAAQARNPQRFVGKHPQPPSLPTAVWINPPENSLREAA